MDLPHVERMSEGCLIFSRIAAPWKEKFEKVEPETPDIPQLEELDYLVILQQKLVLAPMLVLAQNEGHIMPDTNAFEKIFFVDESSTR